jgi:hypothetical protein
VKRARIKFTHSEHSFIVGSAILQNSGDGEIFTLFSRAGAMAPLGTAGRW